MKPMNIIVQDCGAYAFEVQLCRELARRGHHVLYLYAAHIEPKGRLWKEPTDPATFDIAPIKTGLEYPRYSLIKRRAFEQAYGRATTAAIDAVKPHVVFNSNCPLEPAAIIQRHCRKIGAKYVHWMQDIHSLAMQAILPKKLPVVGNVIAAYYAGVERRLIAAADATIVITDEFAAELKRLRMRPQRCITIPNWMPLDEMKPEEKVNAWSIRNGLDQTTNILYLGTLGFKHSADVYVKLAEHFRAHPDVRIVTIGSGIVMEQLQTLKAARGLDNLVLLGWQKYEEIALILGTADILLAAVAPEASEFSVPCKVLSYLSAGRPVLAAIPPANLVAAILLQNDMGLVADPRDDANVIAAADRLIAEPELRRKFSERGRAYALRTFEIGAIGDKFEAVIRDVTGSQDA